MLDKVKSAAQQVGLWLKKPERLLDLTGILLAAYLVYVTWSFMGPLDLLHVILAGIFIFSALKIVYELTVNRINVPTLASGFFERRKMVEIVQRHAPRTLIDLGSGRGELTRHIARALPQAQVMGIENRLFPYLQAKVYQRLFGPKNLEYRQDDFFSYDCSAADAVVLYLNTKVAERAGEKLRRELKPGTLVVSNRFALGGDWAPAEILQMLFKAKLFVYYQNPKVFAD
ncbi:MAG: hypothetical protein HY053_02025 [Proteobacteria bacterium]|nr:hypothetical protein [Pseudomonadota bacterium]